MSIFKRVKLLKENNMETYTVKAGDSLSKIAVKIYDDASKWREIADINSLANPSSLKIGQVLQLPPKKGAETSTSPVEITIEGKKAMYRFKGTTTKIYLGTMFRKGLSRIGSFNTERFINENPSLLSSLKLSSSEINTLLATSENEGNLDSINTWDNSYLSWGMFQWTLGPGSDPGELPAMLKLAKKIQPASFQKFFGDFGLDVSADTGDITGYVLLKGSKINNDAKKQPFRDNLWALRFALAGQEPTLCAVQVLHAINRFNRFYFTAQSKFGGLSINDMLSSEYAASLLLDQHVNRPGHVNDVVAAALAKAGLSAQQLASGTNADELNVINKYLQIRLTFGRSPMTHSATRALVVKRYLDNGSISAKKESFKSNRVLRD